MSPLADFAGIDLPPGVADAAEGITKRAERRWGALAKQGDPRAQAACVRAMERAAALLWAGALGERRRRS